MRAPSCIGDVDQHRNASGQHGNTQVHALLGRVRADRQHDAFSSKRPRTLRGETLSRRTGSSSDGMQQLPMWQRLGQLLGCRGTQRDPIKPKLGIEIVFAGFVDDPQHSVTGIPFHQFIEPAKLEIIARDISGVILSQTDNEF